MPAIHSYVHKIFKDEMDGSERLFYGYLMNYNPQDKVFEVKCLCNLQRTKF
jgi:hypothetical protein